MESENPRTRLSERLLRVAASKWVFRILIVLTILLVPLCGVVVYREMQLAGLPDIGDPFDVEAFGRIEIPDERNAFVEYKQAALLLVQSPEYRTEAFEKYVEAGWNSTPLDIQKWVLKNREALDIWRKGTEKSDALSYQPRNLNLSTALPDVAEARRLFMWLPNLEGSRLELENDYAGAWRWYLAAFRASRHFGMHAVIIQRIIGTVIHDIAAHSIMNWSTEVTVDEVMLQQALREVISAYRMTSPPSDAFKCGYIGTMSVLEQISSDDQAPTPDSRLMCFLFNEPELSRRILQHSFANVLEKIELDENRQQAQADVESRYSAQEAHKAQQPLTATELDRFISRSLFGGLVVGDDYGFLAVVRREHARQRSLEIVLAAQLLRRRQGRFPEKIEQIVSVLHEAGADEPVDPYDTSGKLIRYRADKDGIAAWSIGENGVDDNGDMSIESGVGPRDIGFQCPIVLKQNSSPGAAKP